MTFSKSPNKVTFLSYLIQQRKEDKREGNLESILRTFCIKIYPPKINSRLLTHY